MHKVELPSESISGLNSYEYIYLLLCVICVPQIQPRKHVLDRADYTAPTRQRGLDHTDQGYICPERSRS